MSDSKLSPETAALRLGIFGFDHATVLVSDESRDILADRLDEDFEPCNTIACPAEAAGYDGSTGIAVAVAKRYDRIVGTLLRRGDIERVDGDQLITEEAAEQAWLDALRHYKATAVAKRQRDRQRIEAGEDVARKLGWLDDDETVDATDLSDEYPVFN